VIGWVFETQTNKKIMWCAGCSKVAIIHPPFLLSSSRGDGNETRREKKMKFLVLNKQHQPNQSTKQKTKNDITQTFSPISKTVPPHICARAHNEHTESQFAYPLLGPHSVPLLKGNRQGHANATFLFLFFPVQSRGTEPSAAVQGGHFLWR